MEERKSNTLSGLIRKQTSRGEFSDSQLLRRIARGWEKCCDVLVLIGYTIETRGDDACVLILPAHSLGCFDMFLTNMLFYSQLLKCTSENISGLQISRFPVIRRQ